ncbi:MAG: CoA-binding protein [Candidatus Helarchaeota archaeon]|nr:CoA-binding protein [Candidatus Helarchaeota archaeon]
MDEIEFQYLFNPRNICVIGASNRPNKVGAQVLTNLISCKFQNDIFPINPKHEKIFGLKAYANLKKISNYLDLAIITVPNFKVPAVLEECIEQNVKFAVIITAGFGEMIGYDPNGFKLRDNILNLLRKGDTRIIGPNCMGIACTESNLVGLMGFGFPPARHKINASIVSQSGTWGITTMRAGTIHGLGFSKFVSSGNEIDLRFEDYLEYFGTDPDTQIILGFIEGLRQGRKFIELAKKIEKPIIFIKGGKTKSGREAAKSHTGSLAGSQELYDAIFKQHGVIEVNNMAELVDTGRAFAQCLSYDPPKFPRGKRIGLSSGGGGFCVLLADHIEAEGLIMAQLDASTIEKLNKLLPPYWPHRNPVDLVASWQIGSYTKVIKILLDDPNIDAVITRPPIGFSLIYDNNNVQEFARENPFSAIGVSLEMMKDIDLGIVRGIGRMAQKSSKPIIIPLGFYTAEGPKQYEIIREFLTRGVLVAPSGQAAARILIKLYDYYKYQQRIKNEKP